MSSLSRRSVERDWRATRGRRTFLRWISTGLAWGTAAGAGVGDDSTMSLSDEALKNSWMSAWMDARANRVANVRGENTVLDVGRFWDASPIYWYLKAPIEWFSTDPESRDFAPVKVPAGFVTDLASIPRPFWCLFPCEGNYAYAAIVHDYLYWEQQRSRLESDLIFQSCMNDFKVDALTASILFSSVRAFGRLAWNDNAAQKRAGERRTLRRFPTDPRVRWSQWKLERGALL